jgi:hypothetical protein
MVALSRDAHRRNRLAGLAITTPGFARRRAIAALGLSTVLVQEGDGLAPEPGENLTGFPGGFRARRRI